MLYSHFHSCLCGFRWRCAFKLLSYQGKRELCSWSDSICNSCLENMVANQPAAELWRMVEVADPSTAFRLTKLLRNLTLVASGPII